MSTLITGASAIVGGRLAQPVLAGDSILVKGGKIDRIGFAADVAREPHDSTIDVANAVIIPGLIDPHTHPVLGDFTPRQNTLGWVTAHLNGGVTTLISAGETHWPGRRRAPIGAKSIAMAAAPSSLALPAGGAKMHRGGTALMWGGERQWRGRRRTPIGAKSIAMAAAQSSLDLRPGGAKLHGGAILIEPGLSSADFDDMERAGVRLVGEIGLGTSIDADRIRGPIEEARARGWTIPLHVGGASVPGSHVVSGDLVVELNPDGVSHAKGGPTGRAFAEILRVIEGTTVAIEVVQAGNTRALVRIVEHLNREGLLSRLQFGTDSPSGTGVMPLGILRTIAYATAFAGVDPVAALCCASGEVAARYRLDAGVIEAGRPADLVVLDVPL